jgi:hypothetical protein
MAQTVTHPTASRRQMNLTTGLMCSSQAPWVSNSNVHPRCWSSAHCGFPRGADYRQVDEASQARKQDTPTSAIAKSLGRSQHSSLRTAVASLASRSQAPRPRQQTPARDRPTYSSCERVHGRQSGTTRCVPTSAPGKLFPGPGRGGKCLAAEHLYASRTVAAQRRLRMKCGSLLRAHQRSRARACDCTLCDRAYEVSDVMHAGDS